VLCSVALIGAFALFAFFSWRCWPDLLVDFGEELYIPWRLTQGEVLYRDLAFIGGPLSLYLHALLFRLFGVSLTVLVAANLCVLAATTAMLWWIFRRSGTYWSATIVTLFFLAVVAFAQYGLIGNYNYICPYRHEVTHGLALGLANLICLIRYRETRQARWLMAAACFLGLVVLTKVEMTLAAFLATAAALVIIVRADRQMRELSPGGSGSPDSPGPPPRAGGQGSRIGRNQSPWRLVGGAIALALLPTAIAVAALSRSLSWNTAWRGVLSTYLLALKPSVSASSAFYKTVGGWDDPAGNLAVMALYAAVTVGVLIGAFAVERLFGGRKWPRTRGVVAGFAAFCVGTWFIPANVASGDNLTLNWFDLPRAFPLLLTAVTVLLLWRELRRPSVAALPLCLSAVFALGLLPKVALSAGWSHYGFVLNMPATLVLVHVAIYSLPNWIARRCGSAACFRGVLVGLVAACALARVLNWTTIDRFRTQPVVTGPDCFYVDPDPTHDDRSGPTLWILGYLQKEMRDDETLVVFPNGTMLNYLLRKRNPTPYQMFTPFEFEVFGDEAVAGSVIRAAPDWVVLVTMDMSVFGRGNFGDPHYAVEIRRFLEEEYEIAETQSSPPYASHEFSAVAFRRRSR
jgi:hypothetical protein